MKKLSEETCELMSEAAAREKKNSRPVIADGVEYDSYADYLKSREEKE